jgi:hypothetical protein
MNDTANKPKPHPEVLKVGDIYAKLKANRSYTLPNARADYREAFGVLPDDKSIDQELQRLMEEHIWYSFVNRLRTHCAPELAIPLRLSLALMLREGAGRGTGARPTAATEVRALMSEARELKAKYMKKQGLKAGSAEYEAAEFLAEHWKKWRGRPSHFSAEQIIDFFRHPGRVDRGRKRSRKEA